MRLSVREEEGVRGIGGGGVVVVYAHEHVWDSGGEVLMRLTVKCNLQILNQLELSILVRRS